MKIFEQFVEFKIDESEEKYKGFLFKNNKEYFLKIDSIIWNPPLSSKYTFIKGKINGKKVMLYLLKIPIDLKGYPNEKRITSIYKVVSIFVGIWFEKELMNIQNISLFYNYLLKWFDLDNEKSIKDCTILRKNFDYSNLVKIYDKPEEIIKNVNKFNKKFSNISINNMDISFYIKYQSSHTTNAIEIYKLILYPNIYIKFKKLITYVEFEKIMDIFNKFIYLIFNKIELYQISSNFGQYPFINDDNLSNIYYNEMSIKKEENINPLFYLSEIKDLENFFKKWNDIYKKYFRMIDLYTLSEKYEENYEIIFLNYVKALEFYVLTTDYHFKINTNIHKFEVSKDMWIKRIRSEGNKYFENQIFRYNEKNKSISPTTRGMLIILFENYNLESITSIIKNVYKRLNFIKQEENLRKIYLNLSKIIKDTRNYYTHPSNDKKSTVIAVDNNLEIICTLLKILIEISLLIELNFDKKDINVFIKRKYQYMFNF